MLAMRGMTTVPTVQYLFGLPGMHPEHSIRTPALAEGEYTHRTLLCDSSDGTVNAQQLCYHAFRARVHPRCQ
jgi:hypothetical protein